MSAFLAFLGVSALVIMTPGPDTAVTIRNALVGGRAGGVSTAAGIACGQLVWSSAASLGIVAILLASEPVFLAARYAGAAYLVYLGLQSLREAFRRAPSQEADRAAPRRRMAAVTAFRQGLVSDLGNPKMAVFFASLLPQFAAGGQHGVGWLMLLGLVFAAMTFAWLSLYAALVARGGTWLRKPAIRRSLEGVTGTLLLGFGLRIAVEPR